MLNESILKLLSCCLYSLSDSHLVDKPVLLSCSHYACLECVSGSQKPIFCAICNCSTERVFNNSGCIIEDLNHVINENIDALVEHTTNKIHNETSQFISDIENDDDYLNAKIEFVKEEIELRIETLKIELDHINEHCVKKLDELKIKFKELKQVNKYFDKYDSNGFKKDLKKFDDEIKKQLNATSKDLQIYQNKLKNLKQLVREFHEDQLNFNFQNSQFSFDTSLVGQLSSNLEEIESKVLRDRLKNVSNFKEINIENFVNDICILCDGHLVISAGFKSELLMYDENMVLEKRVNKINDQELRTIGIDANGLNEIYVSDYNRVLKVDTDFNVLAVFGEDRNSKDMLKNVNGICFNDGSLYVCNQSPQKIEVFDSDLNHKSSYKFPIHPWYIKIIGDTACIRPAAFSLYFYKLPDFKFKFKYENHNGIIGCVNSCFYEYFAPTKRFYCYKQDGTLIEEINGTSGFANYYGSIVYFKSKFLIGTLTMKKLLYI